MCGQRTGDMAYLPVVEGIESYGAMRIRLARLETVSRSFGDGTAKRWVSFTAVGWAFKSGHRNGLDRAAGAGFT